jgi:hypothetical protein
MKHASCLVLCLALAPTACAHHRKQSSWDPTPLPPTTTTTTTAATEKDLPRGTCPVLEAVFAEGALDDLYAALAMDARGPAPGEIDLKGVIHATRARAGAAAAAGDHARLFWGAFSYPNQGYPEPPRVTLAAELRGAREKDAPQDPRYFAAKKLYDKMLATSETHDYAVGLRVSHKTTNRGAVVCERSLWDAPYGREEYRCFLFGLVAGATAVAACPAP